LTFKFQFFIYCEIRFNAFGLNISFKNFIFNDKIYICTVSCD